LDGLFIVFTDHTCGRQSRISKKAKERVTERRREREIEKKRVV
jgi:hypothetical protein